MWVGVSNDEIVLLNVTTYQSTQHRRGCEGVWQLSSRNNKRVWESVIMVPARTGAMQMEYILARWRSCRYVSTSGERRLLLPLAECEPA